MTRCWKTAGNRVELASITALAVREYGDAKLIRNNQNRRRRGGNNNGPRPQQMGGGNNYGNRLDNRQRGNASQLLEKYRALARDAQQAGDRVTAEYYLQYADHYYRVLGDYRDKQPEQNRQRYDEDNSGYAANGDDSEGDDGDQDDDRSEARSDDRDDGRQDDNRGNYRDDRSNQNRNQRDNSQRDNNARDGGQRDNYRDNNRGEQQRETQRDNQRDTRRDGDGNRDRQQQGWNGNNSNRNGGGDRPEANRNNDRPAERRERPERRPEPSRPAYAEPAMADEGPIPGLPGPATLRVNVSEDAAPRTLRAPRTPRREVAAVESAPIVEAIVADTADEAAPRRRGRPRKVVADAVAED